MGLAVAFAAGVMFSAPLADADQRVISGNDKNLSAENMEIERSQTLNIKKLPRNPHDDPIPGAKPYGGIEGLTFRLSLVDGVDATSAAGREAAKQYTVQRARHEGFSESREAKTNADGVADFRDLGPGLYLIEEFAPDDEHDWRLSRPQLVILPLGDVMGENYSYDNVLVTKPDPGTPPTTPPGTPPEEPGTPPSTPEKPGDPGTPPSAPGEPGAPEVPDTPDSNGERSDSGDTERPRDGALAVTGANVLWAFLAGVGLIVFGFVLMRKKN
ncbi:cell surface protein [Corynebacterium pseudodiphtheriticum]|uniref:cell surface protein n=2 Tax=Corynebacteriaceae TaxID=1653 RepID=UPI00223BEDC6|nr:cell surface protein [Corynebacterium pseudodiphtheriticum]MCT1635053.1 cell surface protein [Corynebacterium pseudodiphtheriticum]MCT1666146.1 cell surface protein [Corynebacterium pseudodiphtheriticum]MDK4244176.1 cell surface protein [Corynebacterium pseudodiphtheriticum]MDK4318482.1 cell surface protein [Corynebacterium pseudodiphtheriticum]